MTFKRSPMVQCSGVSNPSMRRKIRGDRFCLTRRSWRKGCCACQNPEVRWMRCISDKIIGGLRRWAYYRSLHLCNDFLDWSFSRRCWTRGRSYAMLICTSHCWGMLWVNVGYISVRSWDYEYSREGVSTDRSRLCSGDMPLIYPHFHATNPALLWGDISTSKHGSHLVCLLQYSRSELTTPH
jgi:hypothetical protein